MKKLMLILFVFCMIIPFSSFGSEKVVVYAAASATNVMDEVLALYNKKGGNASASYGASGALVKQILSGAPAGIFISANQEWMDKLEKEKIIVKDSRKNLLGNSLVLITNKKNNIKLDFSKKIDFNAVLNSDKTPSYIAIGEPKSVPAGNYAVQSFTKLGYYKDIEKNIITASSVREALLFVSKNEAKLGVVFGTDAKQDKNVSVVAEFPDNTHDDISYPVAIIKENNNKEVQKLYDFLLSEEAKKIYKKYGFKI